LTGEVGWLNKNLNVFCGKEFIAAVKATETSNTEHVLGCGCACTDAKQVEI